MDATSEDSMKSEASTSQMSNTENPVHIPPTKFEKAIGSRIDMLGLGTGHLVREANNETRAENATKQATGADTMKVTIVKS